MLVVEDGDGRGDGCVKFVLVSASNRGGIKVGRCSSGAPVEAVVDFVVSDNVYAV